MLVLFCRFVCLFVDSGSENVLLQLKSALLLIISFGVLQTFYLRFVCRGHVTVAYSCFGGKIEFWHFICLISVTV